MSAPAPEHTTPAVAGDSEKRPATATTDSKAPPPPPVLADGALALPDHWKYRSRKIFGFTLPWYNSPETQVVLIAFICFLCPGMFNALNGLGGGGLLSTKASDDANLALYSCFAPVGFFAGSITNRLGIRLTLVLGGIGYSVYVSSYLCFLYTQSIAYVAFAGALLGVCAGILWSAQGAIMMSYPLEKQKGRFIAIFWVIFNFGAVIGALVPLGQNIHNTSAGGVNSGTYIGFLVLTFIGALLAMIMANGDDIIRKDGSKVILMKHPTWKSELLGLWESLRNDYYIILLFPMFLSSNWFYAYQFNEINAVKFNVRTRALNSVLYWSAQMVGAAIFGTLLDIERFRRTHRAIAAWVALLVLTMVIWGGGYEFQKGYTRAETDSKTYPVMDWTTPGYVGPMFLYIFYGMYDAIWQTCVYWFMGAISNNGRKLANFAGFYKGIQSAGGAITWDLDRIGIPFMKYFASTWGLLGGSLIVALPVILTKIKDTTSVEQDLKFSDESIDDVIAQKGSFEGAGHRDSFDA